MPPSSPSSDPSSSDPQTEAEPAAAVAAAPVRERSPLALLVYRGIGVVFVGLAVAGVFLPVLPTTPFLLVALWAFARGAPHWADRLRAHPRFGPTIRDWEARGAIPVRAKVLAVVMMAASFALLAVTRPGHPIILGVVAVVMLGAGAFVVSRPS